MGSAASTLTKKLTGLKLWDSRTTGGSTESELQRGVVVCRSEHGSTPSRIAGIGSAVARTEKGKCTSNLELEEQLESSKVYWSEVSELAINRDEEGAAEMDNREVFKTLQMHSIAPRFFRTFGYDFGVRGRGSSGELGIGEKFAKGGQAELFHVNVTWANRRDNQNDRKEGREWVLKVFEKGTLLRHLQSQWPQGYFQYRAEEAERSRLGNPDPDPDPVRHYCALWYSTLLKDGRFAFLMIKEDRDLRNLIDEKMRRNGGRNKGPFQEDGEAEMIMYRIALGMDWLHNHNIIHRDLKAANVLVSKGRLHGSWMSFIADFECFVGVVGTGFWRAPEVLQACRERYVSQKPELFTKQGDIYSYGMTCYEILSGRYPFDDHSWRDYDLVLDGNRPEVSEYVDAWARDLLQRCWQSDPMDRPSIRDILSILEDNSARVGNYKRKVWNLQGVY